MKIHKPEINPTFYYGAIISYKFHGGISKDRNKYRFRFTLYFKSGDICNTQKSGFKTQAEATKAKEVLIAELVKNEYIPFDYTVKEVFDYWLYEYMIEQKKIRYNTYQGYKNVLYNYLLPMLGETKKLKAVTTRELESIIQSIPYSSVKVHSVKIVRQIFTFAHSNHYISFNPSIAAVEKILKDSQPAQKRDVIPYTVAQIRQLLYQCKQNFQDMYIPLLLAITTSARVSETIALKYSDIDFTANTIYIDRQLGRAIKGDAKENVTTQQLETKMPNGVRSIPLPDWVSDEIIVRRAWYERQKLSIPNFCEMDYICCHCDGTPFHRKSFSRDFHTLTCMCGLPQIHWHDLRHMYASVLKNNAVNMKAISEFLGHASPVFTEEVYVHQEEVAYDCSVLEEEWENIRPNNTEKLGQDELFLPFTDEDYQLIIA